MSRVEDAIRRAAEEAAKDEAPGGVSTAAEVLRLDFEDAATLSRESFPIELSHRRPARPSPMRGPVMEAPALPVTLPVTTRKSTPLLERLDPALAQKVVVDRGILPSSLEQYRRLAASLHHAQLANGTKVVMIASAVSGEGKTLTAANLALTLSESYKRTVLLIDADLRKPGLHTVFAIDNSSGLGDGLSSLEERPVRVRHVTSLLAVLTAGNPTSDPMGGLTSERMGRVLEEARQSFDWVIIDTPPVAFLSDANLLAAMVDAAVLVVRAESTAFELVQRAADAIGRDRTLGVVLNRAKSTESGRYGSYAHYYALVRGKDVPSAS